MNATNYACVVLVLAGVGLAGCNDSFGPDGEPVALRVRNATTETFDSVQVSTIQYGRLDPGEASGYKGFEEIFDYAYTEIHIGDKVGIVQPVDFIGEEPLPPGRYTYQLSFAPSEGTLRDFSIDIQLIVD